MFQEKEPKCLGCLKRNIHIEYQRMIIARQNAEIAKLRRIIASAKQAASEIQHKADDIMAQHQPRGKWAYAKGAGSAAQTIDRRLSG